MKNVLNKIFNKDRNIIIGAIHFAPLLGYKDFPGYKVIIKNALEDLMAFQEGGVDGVIVENNYDIPHKISVEKETVELMTRLGKEIKKQAKIPVGVSVLWNDYKAAFTIAKEIGAQFIRIPVFIDRVKTDYGIIESNPEEVIGFRKSINAENIAIFTDIHVKHSKILNKETIEESAINAIKNNSDALIITGRWTGEAPDIEKLSSVRAAVKSSPILIGSGVNVNNIQNLFNYADGAIVSTFLKEGKSKKEEVNVKGWKQRIDIQKVKTLIRKIKK